MKKRGWSWREKSKRNERSGTARGSGRSRNTGRNDATVANTDDPLSYIIMMLSVFICAVTGRRCWRRKRPKRGQGINP